MKAPVSLHWLRIQYKISLLTFKVLYGTAPQYLGPFLRVADLPSRRALRSASTSRLVVPIFKRSAVGGRTFLVSGCGTSFLKTLQRRRNCQSD